MFGAKRKTILEQTAEIEIPKSYPEPYKDEPAQWESLSDEERLSLWYGMGQSVPDIPDGTDIEPWYEDAASKGDTRAMYVVGKMYYKGIRKEANLVHAGTWYSRASEAGNPFADYELAKMCEFGFGMVKDTESASELYERAYNAFLKMEEKAPNKIIELKLATLSENNLINEADPTTARHWRKLATVNPATPKFTPQIMNDSSPALSDIAGNTEPKENIKISGILKSGRPQNVPAEYIVPAKRNPYAKSDTEEEIHELAMSIQVNGLLYPLLLNKISDTEYRIIAGEKRYKAITRYLHWDTIPSTVHEHLSQNAAQLMLNAANLDVRDYTSGQKLQFYMEVEQVLRDMKDSGEYTGALQKGISEMLGISTHQVRKYKRIVEALPEEQLQKVMDGDISLERAYRLAQSAEKPDVMEEPVPGRTSAFAEEPDSMEEPQPGRTSAFAEKPNVIEEPESGRTSAFVGKADAIEEPYPGRTSAFKDPKNYKEAVSMLRMMPFAPGDICAVLEDGQVQDGFIDRIELSETALLLSVMVNNVRKSYPVSKIGVNIFIGEGCFDTAERTVKAS